MNETCCPLGRVAKSGLFTAVLLSGLAAMTLMVFAPWRALDAAAPATADDPLTHHQFLRPTPSVQEQRGLKNNESDAGQMLSNWTYTAGSDAFGG
jgi:hypothetical protein